MWVATGASELNYKSTFDVKWCDPRTSTNTDDLVVLAELKTKTAASSKLGGNNDQLGLVTDNFAVLTEQAIKLYGPTCACCALCLAQNMNLGCDGKGGGKSGGTQPMRVRPAGCQGGEGGPLDVACWGVLSAWGARHLQPSFARPHMWCLPLVAVQVVEPA